MKYEILYGPTAPLPPPPAIRAIVLTLESSLELTVLKGALRGYIASSGYTREAKEVAQNMLNASAGVHISQ